MLTSLHEAAPGGSPPWPLLGLSMASAATRSVETAVVAVRGGSSSGVDSNVIDVDKEQKQEKKEEKQQ